MDVLVLLLESLQSEAICYEFEKPSYNSKKVNIWNLAFIDTE